MQISLMKKNHNILQAIKWSCCQCHQRLTFHQDIFLFTVLVYTRPHRHSSLGEMFSAGDTDGRII